MKVKHRELKGFTIIEVTLAMAFLSVLLITITFLTVHITSIYQKGLSIKAVTLTGEQLVDEFSRAIASSVGMPVDSYCSRLNTSGINAQDKCKEDRARNYIYQVRYATRGQLGFDTETSKTIPASGVFCTGRYSYLWNSGYVLNEAKTEARNYAAIMKYPDGTTSDDFRLLKIVDLNRSLCMAHLKDGSTSYTYDNVIASMDEDNRMYDVHDNIGTVEEVITNSEDNLALYSLDIFRPTIHNITNHAFYSGTFILATIQGGIDITAQGDYCTDTATQDLNTDFNYCAINKFNFAMRATGENKS